MNTIFAAQKARIPIDVIRIDTEEESSGSTFLQQASYTTNGVYAKLDATAVTTSLPQYLLQLYAADQTTRTHLVFPKRYVSLTCH